MAIAMIEEHQCFNGVQGVYSHQSSLTNCLMRFAVFLPAMTITKKLPALYWLSGLTCNEQNFITKAGAQRLAAELGLILIVPDTSPRGIEIPGDRESYDFGIGAGFYVDATEYPWAKHYQMSCYISDELPKLINQHFPVNPERTGIFGHSMGGHGALVLALKNPQQYRSVSAFAPICAPMQCPWGRKAFAGYLGQNEEAWKNYDATELVEKMGWPHSSILIDQGLQDPFLQEQLKPELLQAACLRAGVPLNLRMQKGYDHSYYFIASFIDDHLRFHASLLYS
ncbi:MULTISPECIES: S-formylglutathione hydrolase [unclassified Legionella]|uniref:S-formylglutathione hydrolase n=1 Tax=unclassified Legionella TaxID=2622702 RepID=UPI002107E4B6|nr:S-formylglutathione hydrolase [Legionella sp. 31fI33]